MAFKLPFNGPVNVLVLGSGGREHALGWRIKQSKHVQKVFFGPGNGGTDGIGTNVPELVPDKVTTKLVDDVARFCNHNHIGLVVIGPEDPLAEGLSDRLQAEAIRLGSAKQPAFLVFGPEKAAAKLEGDKAYAKEMMKAASVPTADSKTFTNYESAVEYVNNREGDVVVKAAGLAKGKGAIVTSSKQEAIAALDLIFIQKAFGEAGDKVVIEDKLVGQELSILALIDGNNIALLEGSQDHKQAHEGDTGPNTGGMGVYCPTPLASDKIMDSAVHDVLVPMADILKRSEIPFKGVLYAGLMLTPKGIKVLEFNTRFGDPETQTLMMKWQGDLFEALCATAMGQLDQVDISFDSRTCVCVVMASEGYPNSYPKGRRIEGIDLAEQDPDITVFHAGTQATKEGIVTSGGRVLNVCALGNNLQEARDKANAACDKIAFEGSWFRRDIGFRVM